MNYSFEKSQVDAAAAAEPHGQAGREEGGRAGLAGCCLHQRVSFVYFRIVAGLRILSLLHAIFSFLLFFKKVKRKVYREIGIEEEEESTAAAK